MLDWLFRKKKGPPQPGAAGTIPAASRSAGATPTPAPPPAVDWQDKLARATGDDDALLALASGPAPVDIKLAAVAALASEDALKRAERELRKHDRRVYRLAKQRHAELLARREARSRAAQLTASAQALLDEPLIAANRLVELDRAWRALDPQWLEASQAHAFAALFERLTRLVRERADHALEAERFDAAARNAAADLRSACEQAAAGAIDRGALAAASAQAQSVLDAAPSGTDPAAAPCEALRAALRTADELALRLTVLEALLHAPAPSGPEVSADAAPEVAGGELARADANASTDIESNAAAARTTADALQRWRAFAPLADAGLAQALAVRFSQWQRAQRQNSPKPPPKPAAPADTTAVQDDGARLERLSLSIEQAEAALAQGNLAAAGTPLAAIEAAARDGALPAALRARIDQLHAEASRLRGWQHWGSGRARDELVAQAEALAAADAGAPDAEVARLTTRQRAVLISEMRARWKELDRHGGASNRALWQRFDAALNAAHAPVAAQAQAQREARESNLQARTALLITLEAVALPGDAEPAFAPDGATPDAATPEAAGAARSPAAVLGAALADFQSAWRKLGPLDHTVPRAEREPLQARMQAAVARIETPLNAARRVAQTQREALIESARALAAAGAVRDSLDQARALQARWQDAARSLPLARAVENALWTDFKAAIDAIYAARQADLAARDAAFKAGLDERAALIARLEALTLDDPPDAVRRTLAELDTQWRQAGAAPRAEAAALEARWRRARDVAQALLLDGKQRRWRAQCDALVARLAARDGMRDGIEPSLADPAPQALPPRWERALARQADAAPADLLAEDDLLLQLEAALGIDSPPAFEAARRALKLQAMKSALEARPASAPVPHTADELLVAALARDALDAANRERLRAAIVALRDATPPGID